MSMSLRTIVITGASDGIGAAGAARLSALGHNVVIVGRSKDKTTAVAAALKADSFVADFSDLEQVRALAAYLLERYERIDALVNNAGGVMGPRRITVDGHEGTFQINHLAHFLLTTLLLDRLIASRASVINTSSVAHKLVGRVNIDDLDSEGRYSPFRAYGAAKLENILFAKELHRRYHEQGVSAAAFHPGPVASNFSNDPQSPFRFAYRSALKRVLLSPKKGADTLEWLATTRPGSDWTSGEYYCKRKIARASKQANDPQVAINLWERSVAMIAKR
jgi:NAD(P)-dependent dehydrogenase (short-subunit alcohol dehydrogenase family)